MTLNIIIIIDPYPAPQKISISSVDFESRELAFNWSPVTFNCPAIRYKLQTLNCGNCPMTTMSTAVTCSDIPSGNQCTFAAEAFDCNSHGNLSEVISVKLTNVPVFNTLTRGQSIHDIL